MLKRTYHNFSISFIGFSHGRNIIARSAIFTTYLANSCSLEIHVIMNCTEVQSECTILQKFLRRIKVLRHGRGLIEQMVTTWQCAFLNFFCLVFQVCNYKIFCLARHYNGFLIVATKSDRYESNEMRCVDASKRHLELRQFV